MLDSSGGAGPSGAVERPLEVSPPVAPIPPLPALPILNGKILICLKLIIGLFFEIH